MDQIDANKLQDKGDAIRTIRLILEDLKIVATAECEPSESLTFRTFQINHTAHLLGVLDGAIGHYYDTFLRRTE